MFNALVTGAGGFLGAHLARTLAARGYAVHGLVRRKPLQGGAPPPFPLRLADLRDPQAVAEAVCGMDVVFHVAGLTQAVCSRDYYETNARGTLHVAQACAQQPTPPHLIYVSSLAAAGPAPAGQPLRETDRPHPRSNYGRSKRLGERFVESLADRVPAAVVRPAIVFGPHDRVGWQMFATVRHAGIHFVPCLARYRHSVIHVDDLVELLIRVAQRGERIDPALPQGSGRGSGYYFAACPETVAYADLGRLIGAAQKRWPGFPLHLASPLVWITCGVMEGVSRVTGHPHYLSLDRAREITAGDWLCSPDKALRQLEMPFPCSLAARLEATATWYREQGWLP